MPASIRATFYKVKDNKEKIAFIVKKSEALFLQKKKLLILAPNFAAAEYVEELLWRVPIEGFIPHIVSDTATAEWIAITLQQEINVNKATCLLNLRQEAVGPPLCSQEIEEIYEIWDETDSQKKTHSSKKWSDYESRGFLLDLI